MTAPEKTLTIDPKRLAHVIGGKAVEAQSNINELLQALQSHKPT